MNSKKNIVKHLKNRYFMQILCKKCHCIKEETNFFKVMVHTLYRTAVYNGCKKSVRMKLKIHRASNRE